MCGSSDFVRRQLTDSMAAIDMSAERRQAIPTGTPLEAWMELH